MRSCLENFMLSMLLHETSWWKMWGLIKDINEGLINRVIKLSGKYCRPVLLFIVFLHQLFYQLFFILYNFLELCSMLSEKKIFVTNFPFLTDLPRTLRTQPLNNQNLKKIYCCWCALTAMLMHFVGFSLICLERLGYL